MEDGEIKILSKCCDKYNELTSEIHSLKPRIEIEKSIRKFVTDSQLADYYNLMCTNIYEGVEQVEAGRALFMQEIEKNHF